ncbi:hypothetical protein BDQ17DRAFT_1367361 [Cyathus striatus]|nr:hypothetical protein BDQ17DRAFT_1367361 [Cyathus striatus]
MRACCVLSTSGSQLPFLSSSLSVSVFVDYLATDHPMIRRAVMEQGYVETLALLVKSITPDERGKRECRFGRMRVWVWLSCVSLENASNTTPIRQQTRRIPNKHYTLPIPHPSTTPDKPPFSPQGTNINILPLLSVSLVNPHVDVRTAACQCIRALSRAVESLRTSVIDSGLVMRVWEVVFDEW